VAVFVKETLPQKAENTGTFGGYDRVLRDRSFMLFAVNFTLTQTA